MTTIRDVAKHAGVSPITVSRVVNEASNVDPDTRARVEKAIEDLGYVPNLAARSLRSKQSHTLALILPDVTNAFWTTVARGVEDSAQTEDYSVFLCNTDENPEKLTRYINTVIRQRVDGVLVAPVSTDASHLAPLLDMKIPVVVIDRRVNHWQGDSVYCDSIAGAQALTQHLVSLGHQRIAIISGPAATSTAEDRVAGYCLALHKAGIPLDKGLILRGEYRESSGIALTHQLMESECNPTAIIAANNVIASGVVYELSLKSLRIPEDIAVVCFDETPEMERHFPFLTNVTQPAYDIGINAAQLLLSRIHAKDGLKPRQVVLPTRLVLRNSCGRFLKTAGPLPPIHYSLGANLTESQLVKPLSDADRDLLPFLDPNLAGTAPRPEQGPAWPKPDKKRLARALAFQKTDRLPTLFNRFLGHTVVSQILGHEVSLAPDGLNIHPADLVEFALKMGLDAVPCEISWNLGPVSDASGADLLTRVSQLVPPTPLAVQLSALENLLNAADGTGVGVYVRFSSFLDQALRVFAGKDPRPIRLDQPELARVMDMLVRHQSRVMGALCDRFAPDLLFVSIRDDMLSLQPELFREVVLPRLARLLIPAREHGLPIAIDSLATCELALPGLVELGVRILQSADLENCVTQDLLSQWAGKIVFIGGISNKSITRASAEKISEQVRQVCEIFRQRPGFVLGLDANEDEDGGFQSQNFLSMVRAVQRYGLSRS